MNENHSWWREGPQIVKCWLEWSGRSKCRATGLDASLSLLSTSRRCSRKQSPSLPLILPIYIFLHKVHVNQQTFVKVHVKRSVVLLDHLPPVILSAFKLKDTSRWAHVEVPGWPSDFPMLLTRKFPMHLSRLNDISGSPPWTRHLCDEGDGRLRGFRLCVFVWYQRLP